MLNAQSLRTVIAIIITLLLLTVALLIDMVFVSTSQKNYIHQKTNDSRTLAISIENILRADQDGHLQRLTHLEESHLKKMAVINDISQSVILGPEGSSLFLINKDNDTILSDILINSAIQSRLSGKSRVHLHGKTWGVFFIRNHYLIVSAPIRIQGSALPAAVSNAINLAPFYSLQRKNQLVILFYTIINIILLVVIGTYAISRAAIRPINSLVKRAEERQEHDNLDFFYPRGRNEFRRLSTSLNRMLDRIEGDKQRLQESLFDLEEANREIKNRQNELIRAEKLASVGRLSAGIAHEIGNPIGIVLGYLEMLGHQDLSEAEKQDYISRCANEIQKINTIIRELLDFSRPSGKEGTETVGVHELIKETMDLLAVQPVMRNINKKFEFNAVCDNIYAPPDKLRQVFVNLILNAADALSTNPSGTGEIVIRSSVVDDNSGKKKMLHIEIADNGVGIQPADLETIFDPFYTTKDPGFGTGLGLYVCYMIIDNLNGSISVDSRQGEGTTFTLDLPLLNSDTNKS